MSIPVASWSLLERDAVAQAEGVDPSFDTGDAELLLKGCTSCLVVRAEFRDAVEVVFEVTRSRDLDEARRSRGVVPHRVRNVPRPRHDLARLGSPFAVANANSQLAGENDGYLVVHGVHVRPYQDTGLHRLLHHAERAIHCLCQEAESRRQGAHEHLGSECWRADISHSEQHTSGR